MSTETTEQNINRPHHKRNVFRTSGAGDESTRSVAFSFLRRFIGVSVTLMMFVAVLSFSLVIADRIGIAGKALRAFKPYSSSMPYLIIILAVILLLCHPTISKWAGSFSKFSVWNASAERDKGIVITEKHAELLRDIVKLAVREEFTAMELVSKSENGLRDSPVFHFILPEMSAQKDFDHRKNQTVEAVFAQWAEKNRRESDLLRFHAVDIGGQLTARDVRIGDGASVVDGLIKRGTESIFVEVATLQALRKDLHRISRMANLFREDSQKLPRRCATRRFFHLVVDCNGCKKADEDTIKGWQVKLGTGVSIFQYEDKTFS